MNKYKCTYLESQQIRRRRQVGFARRVKSPYLTLIVIWLEFNVSEMQNACEQSEDLMLHRNTDVHALHALASYLKLLSIVDITDFS